MNVYDEVKDSNGRILLLRCSNVFDELIALAYPNGIGWTIIWMSDYSSETVLDYGEVKRIFDEAFEE